VIVHDHLRSSGCPRSAEDARHVFRIVTLRQLVRTAPLGHDGKEFILCIGCASGRPSTEADARRPMVTDKGSHVEVLVTQDQRRIDRTRQLRHHLLVDLDIERTDHRSDPPCAEPDQEFFETFIGEQQNAAALCYSLTLEKSRDVDRYLVEFAECDRGLLIEIDDRDFTRIARLVFGEQLGNRLVRNTKLMVSENARHTDLPHAAGLNVRSLPATPSSLPGAPSRSQSDPW